MNSDQLYTLVKFQPYFIDSNYFGSDINFTLAALSVFHPSENMPVLWTHQSIVSPVNACGRYVRLGHSPTEIPALARLLRQLPRNLSFSA